MFKRLGAFFLDVLEVIVFAVGIFFFIYLLVMRPHKISGQSMMPNFQDSEYLLTEKVTYYTRNPERGDVVVFVPPSAAGKMESVTCGDAPESPAPPLDEYIKRVIAVPGERITIKESKIYINDKLLKEPYLKDGVVTSTGPFLCEGREYTIPEGRYFVMGDNRPNSSDSRYWGPITKKEMTGRAWVSYWPIASSGVVKDPNYNF